MKKFGIIFLMSCLLSYMPTMFGAQNTQPGALSRMAEDGYCYRRCGEGHFTPLKNLVESGKDKFSVVLESIEKQALEYTKKETQLRALPIFTVNISSQNIDTIEITHPTNAESTSHNSKVLHQIFSGLESGKQHVTLFDVNAKPVATLYSLKHETYNPNKRTGTLEENTVNSMSGISTSSKATSSWRVPFVIGALVGICSLYAISKLEYWNKDLAPSMEAFFTRLCNSCQGMLSRISPNTNLRN